jgi:dipeptidyl aminopeptidase/acylaminoacyl peptidase
MAADQDKILKPYGQWPSPITPESMAGQLRLEDVQWDSDGKTMVWLEGRSDHNLLVAEREGEATRDLSWEQSVRAGIGYGGGDFAVNHGVIYHAGRDGRLYRRELTYGQPIPLTPAFGATASPAPSPDGRWLLYVHSHEGVDSLGLASTDGSGWPVQIVQGADFYMQPAWHPSGKIIAWVEWDHPNMPWDGGRLMLAGFSGSREMLANIRCLAGDENTPVFQPVFSPDGIRLSFLQGSGETDRLVVCELQSGELRVLMEYSNLLPPAWNQGMRWHGWSPDSSTIYSLRDEAGFFSIWRTDLASGISERLDMDPYTWFDQLSVAPAGDKIAFIASQAAFPPRVVEWEGGKTRIVRRSDGETIDPQDFSVPQPLEFSAKDGELVHALYYPPASGKFYSEGLPPAVIYVHGGPTSQVTSKYNPDAVFFTSRGYAYLAVNYRGSSGYGRTYMHALREHWGDLDVEDVASAAIGLADRGLADKDRLVIKGGSAGGYTLLNALIRYPGLFKAGICSYGVSNLFNLAQATDKFEEQYNDRLIGPLPGSAQLYHEWSPAYHAEKIQDALAIFHGSADPVVPLEQSITIVETLKRNGVSHLFQIYEGEGHGWRKYETIVDFYRQIEKFLLERVIFGV